MAWTTEDIPDQTGRTAIVTGSNTGLGFETAAELAAAGARVVLACRTPAKAADAANEIRGRHPSAVVEALELDLGDLAGVRRAAAEAIERFDRIDLLINNAGVMIPPRTETADGFELQFGTNHLGHFALTGLLLDRILATPDSRIVNVSSLAHQSGRMRWDDLQWERSYRRFGAYAQSKLANLLFTFELQRRLAAVDHTTECLAAHPGVSATELGRYIPGANLPGIKQAVLAAMSFTTQSPAGGALPSLRAATDPQAIGGQYYGPGGMREMRGDPLLVLPGKHAVREVDWTRLWDISEVLTGVSFPV